MTTSRLTAALLLLAACSPDRVVSPEPSHPLSASIVFLPPSVTGAEAFAQECATCHSNRDGFDVAYFSYTDTNIVRRALGHVDPATAWRIAGYIGGLQTAHVPEMLRLFQPGGGAVLASDAAFAVSLFGVDQWPASLTAAQLLAIDPLTVGVSIALPMWSNEANKPVEWVPKQPLDQATLDFAGARVRTALASYEATPSIEALALAVVAINEVTKSASNPSSPCPYLWRKRPVEFRKCFDARVYAAALSADYMLRRGLGGFLDSRIHQVWWDAGFVAMQSGQQSAVQKTEDPGPQQEAWFYLGWMFDAANVQAIYTTTILRSRSKPRQATWVAARSLVARAPNAWSEDVNVFADFLELATSTPPLWALNATTFALNELLRRLQAGDRPPAANVYTARTAVNTGMTRVKAKLSAAEYAPLQALANQVLALL